MTGGRKHRRHVTPDEAKLWRAVTKTFVPLTPEREEALAPGPPADAPPPPTRNAASPNPPFVPAKARQPGQTPLADFDHKRARRPTSGRLPIEARLDLHGLRQDEARAELLRFLVEAQRNGSKHVKVITGKGAPNTDDAELRPFSLFEDGRRGVLREQVPRWLSEAAFRLLVVSFTVAGRGHGGGGALYVQVRKRG